ncbi:MAG TPA: serine/threonine-protein kinase [Bryobacteraceae bacterium]|nr:serine/threonine-protein kinase [Bryobacteraceae bacterium]
MILHASRHLGKYEIRQKLGRGGMADVYLAQDTEGGGTVALKLIEHSEDADTRDSIAAERRGAQLQARLAAVDPRVVRVYDSGDTDGFFYVAMEYIDGQDLAELMHGGPLAVEFAVDVATAVAQTLENAHGLQVTIDGKEFHGIVHGDIKPKNIRIDARGQVRVLDFGIAKALSLSRRLTQNEFGSVPYASPERLDTGKVDALSDLWSLAVMLYEMVTGMQPYQSNSTERLESMIRSRIAPPPAPNPCPEPLRRILMKAMAPDPEARYQSAHELRQELIAFRQGAPVAAVAEDMEATRRTFHPAQETDDTRRTFQPAEETNDTRRTWTGAPSAAPGPPPAARRKPGFFATSMKVIAGFVVVCFVMAGMAAFSTYLHYERGQQLAREIETEQLTDPQQIWSRWTELSKDHPSSPVLRAARNAVKQKLVGAADHVIEAYRASDTLPPAESAWKTAHTELDHALSLDPGDGSIRGRLRLTEGHLARINGSAHKDPGQLNEAVVDFGEAEHLMGGSPDPELGLARVYLSELDIDKAYDAFQEAEKRGYQLGNRDNLQLAEGYRARGDRLWWDSRNVRGLPQEKDEIERAAEDYKRAMELYQAVAPYGGSVAKMAQVQTSLESVDFRLQQIEQPEQQPVSKLREFLDKLQSLRHVIH